MLVVFGFVVCFLQGERLKFWVVLAGDGLKLIHNGNSCQIFGWVGF